MGLSNPPPDLWMAPSNVKPYRWFVGDFELPVGLVLLDELC